MAVLALLARHYLLLPSFTDVLRPVITIAWTNRIKVRQYIDLWSGLSVSGLMSCVGGEGDSQGDGAVSLYQSRHNTSVTKIIFQPGYN